MKVKIRAKYMATVELIVEVADEADPMNPASWEDIEREEQLDYNLYDVESWQPAGPED